MGDTVEIGSEEYEVTAAVDPSEFYINRAWEFRSLNRVKIQWCAAPKTDLERQTMQC